MRAGAAGLAASAVPRPPRIRTAMFRRLLCTLLTALACALPARAWARDIVIRDYRSEVVVLRDGSIEVTETLRCAFEGSWNGIYRDISLQHMTGQGRRARLHLEVLGVTDQNGNALEYWDEKGEGGARRIRVRVPGAFDATRTVVIRYRVRDAIRWFFARDQGGLHDELYWNVTGNAWAFPIEHAFFRLTLPEGLQPTQSHAYTGYTGSTANDAELKSNGSGVTAEVTRTLAPGEGLTVAVAWPAGVLPRPSEGAVRRGELLALWPFALPLLVLALMGRHWWRHGRDPAARPMVVGYEPPAGMTPAEIGTLVDNSADLRDITSTLVDLAVRGYIGIEELDEKHLFGLVSSTDWAFHRRNDSSEGLLPHERQFLDALFSGGVSAPSWGMLRQAMVQAQEARAAGRDFDPQGFLASQTTASDATTVRLSSLRNQFYTSLPGIRKAIFDRLIERGYYLKRPDNVKGAWLALGIVLCILSGIAAGVLSDHGMTSPNPLALGVGGVLSGLVIAGFGLAMGKRTEPGARAAEASLGFREFLDKVESDRYRRMITSPEMFERYLPYAMAFGVEARWARAFEGIYTQAPGWYVGSGYHNFSATHFSSQMSSLSSHASSTLSSSPSGSSGGGSSGGGSGGGGGGGW